MKRGKANVSDIKHWCVITSKEKCRKIPGKQKEWIKNKPRFSGELEELPFGGEDDERDVSVAQNGDLMGFLEQPSPSLGESHLPTDLVLNPLQLNPPSSHLSLFLLRPTTRATRKKKRLQSLEREREQELKKP